MDWVITIRRLITINENKTWEGGWSGEREVGREGGGLGKTNWKHGYNTIKVVHLWKHAKPTCSRLCWRRTRQHIHKYTAGLKTKVHHNDRKTNKTERLDRHVSGNVRFLGGDRITDALAFLTKSWPIDDKRKTCQIYYDNWIGFPPVRSLSLLSLWITWFILETKNGVVSSLVDGKERYDLVGRKTKTREK